MFPLNPTKDFYFIRRREKFKVNKSHTESYKKSTISYLQRRSQTSKDLETKQHLPAVPRLGDAEGAGE